MKCILYHRAWHLSQEVPPPPARPSISKTIGRNEVQLQLYFFFGTLQSRHLIVSNLKVYKIA